MKNKILITLCIFFISWGVRAHQPDLSSMVLVEREDNQWILQVRAALTAFEYEIHHHYGEGSYATPEAFQELVIQHLRNNISILHNEANGVELLNGVVKLGHETSVVFEVKGMPENLQSLIVRNSSFKDISRNQSALIILKEGFAKDQFTLDNSNAHTAELIVNAAKFELATPTEQKANYLPLMIFGVALVSISLLLFLFRDKLNYRYDSPLNKA